MEGEAVRTPPGSERGDGAMPTVELGISLPNPATDATETRPATALATAQGGPLRILRLLERGYPWFFPWSTCEVRLARFL